MDYTVGGYPKGVAIGDLDGDGKLDMVIANATYNSISIFKNTSTNGNISFAAKVDYPTSSYPYNVAIADIDGDGKPDIAVTNYSSNAISIFKNNGTIGAISFAPKVNFTTGLNPFWYFC